MATLSTPSVPVSDAARRLDVSEQRVRAMIATGAIEAKKAAGPGGFQRPRLPVWRLRGVKVAVL